MTGSPRAGTVPHISICTISVLAHGLCGVCHEAYRYGLRAGPAAQTTQTMLATALPFIWLGVTLTLKRLRSAGWPISLVLLFFAPFLKIVFLLALCIVPERE